MQSQTQEPSVKEKEIHPFNVVHDDLANYNNMEIFIPLRK